MEIVEINEVSIEVFEHLIRFCYNPMYFLKISDIFMNELLKANAKFQVSLLNDFIAHRLEIIEPLDKENMQKVEPTRSLLNSSTIQQKMQPALRNFKEISDVTFQVENNFYYLHRVILSSQSEWFESMLSKKFNEGVSYTFGYYGYQQQ